MFIRRFTGSFAALALCAACVDAPTAPQALEGPEPSFAIVGQGQGAIVDHFSDEGLILLTMDADVGLYSVHYTNSDQLSAFVGCAVPAFSGALDALNVAVPSGKLHVGGTGDTYVMVNYLGGFPGNLCDEPLAEGTVNLHVSVNQVPEDSPGRAGASFGSDGVITVNSDGSEVRLHQTRKGLQPMGTVSLR